MNIKQQNDRLNELFNVEQKVYADYALACGVSETILWVLLVMADTNKHFITQAELSSKLHISKQTINSAVKSLVNMQFAEMIVSKQNKKIKEIHLTNKGKAFFDKHITKLIDAELSSLSDLEENEREVFIKLSQTRIYSLRTKVEALIKNQEEEA